jgi:hypothetical protein
MAGDVLQEDEEDDEEGAKMEYESRRASKKPVKPKENKPSKNRKTTKESKDLKTDDKSTTDLKQPGVNESASADSSKASKRGKGKGRSQFKSIPVIEDDDDDQPPVAQDPPSANTLQASTDDERMSATESTHESASEMYDTEGSARPPSSLGTLFRSYHAGPGDSH